MARKAPKTIEAAKRLRTIGTLVKLHVAIAEDVATGGLSPEEADRITRLCGTFLSESKKGRRMPSEGELSDLGAAVIALLTIEKDGSSVNDRGHEDPDPSEEAVRKRRKAKAPRT